MAASTNEDKQKNLFAKRFVGLENNIWIEFQTLAVAHQAVNVGLGFIDFEPPPFVLDIYEETIKERNPALHQYTRARGHPRLVQAVSNLYSSLFNRKIDPLNEILIASGAFSSLFISINSFVNPGDEVILIEPSFDCYEPMVRSVGGIVRCIPLRPRVDSSKQGISSSADWTLDKTELESTFNSQTRLIIVNTPNNPLGKVFTREELQQIADLCQKHDVICISDEVYEWITYNPNLKHIRMATLPNMWERTLTIGSAGKTFSATALKTGWTIGPEKLIRSCQIIQQTCSSSSATLAQEVIARCFEQQSKISNSSECFFNSISAEFLPKRDKMIQALHECGMKPVIPDGGYFLIADFSPLVKDGQFPSEENNPKDFQFVRYLIKEKKLATIPVSGFYTAKHRHIGENYIRICFTKKDETLNQVIDILRKLQIE